MNYQSHDFIFNPDDFRVQNSSQAQAMTPTLADGEVIIEIDGLALTAIQFRMALPASRGSFGTWKAPPRKAAPACRFGVWHRRLGPPELTLASGFTALSTIDLSPDQNGQGQADIVPRHEPVSELNTHFLQRICARGARVSYSDLTIRKPVAARHQHFVSSGKLHRTARILQCP